MRILIAPQGFKGTLTGPEAAQAIAIGLRRRFALADIVELPIADGGHGTLDAMLGAAGGNRILSRVMGPMSHPTDAEWGLLPTGTAIIEMAQASGLTLVSESDRDPMRATTYGTGQLITEALNSGARHLIVGVGGSATSDGGAGAAQALGARLLNARGGDIELGAGGLMALHSIDLEHRHPMLRQAVIEVAVDVSNPLTGPHGAAFTYGPQKGALPEQVPLLEVALSRMASVIESELDLALSGAPYMGAAGGLSAGLVAFANARIMPGAKVILDALRFDEFLDGMDLVVTGEGRLDSQTIFDKGPIEVARRASAAGIPAIAVVGSVGSGAEETKAHGIHLIEACSQTDSIVPRSKEDTMTKLADAAERAARRWAAR